MTLIKKVLKVKSFKPDKVLLIALIVGFAFCLYGITWRQTNPDDMAFQPLFLPGKLPFNPGWFHKPPFHTYFNYFLSTLPIDTIGSLFDIPKNNLDYIKLVWSRVLTSILFLFSICIVFQITLKAFGLFSARIVALIFATSAGLIASSHFLTTDIPVMFWMLATFYFCCNILVHRNLSDYIIAGLLTGISMATKYNGLAIGVAIVVAHILSNYSYSEKSIEWKQIILSKKIYLGLIMVIVGFVAGNPFCLLDYHTFKSDFRYNYIVTPVYDGQSGHSYWTFFLHVKEIIGLPSLLICLVGVGYSIFLAWSNRSKPIQKGTILLSLSVLAVYYYKFGSFPRLETRFVLPLVPFFFIVSGSLWNSIARKKNLTIFFAAIIITYNLACDFYVGSRFLGDPRTTLRTWANKNISTNSSLESDLYTPKLDVEQKRNIKQITTPNIDGRYRIFLRMFRDPFIIGSEDDRKTHDAQIEWYTVKELTVRNSDYIALNSLYYNRFTQPGLTAQLYPSMGKYFLELINEQYPYKIVFDQESERPPKWVYPNEIDFLHNRVIVLKRTNLY